MPLFQQGCVLGAYNPSSAKLRPDAAAGSNTSEAQSLAMLFTTPQEECYIISRGKSSQVQLLRKPRILLSGWQPAQPPLLQGAESKSYKREVCG